MNDKKRKSKQYYVNQAKRAKFERNKLRPGLRGFLCTTNCRERECVREAYNILNEFANEMYGPETEMQEPSEGAGVEDSLEEELAALKKEKKSRVRRFHQCESGARNCIFIGTQLEQTAPLVERIAEEIQNTGQQRTRYLLRLLPVQVTCKANEDDIRASAEQMIKDAFTEIGVTYTTVFKSRNQDQLSQSSAQTAVNDLIEAVCPTAKLDHKTPQLTVCMEVIRNVICLGVVKNFFQRRKYNLVELAKPAEEKSQADVGKDAESTAAGAAEEKEAADESQDKGAKEDAHAGEKEECDRVAGEAEKPTEEEESQEEKKECERLSDKAENVIKNEDSGGGAAESEDVKMKDLGGAGDDYTKCKDEEGGEKADTVKETQEEKTEKDPDATNGSSEAVMCADAAAT